MNDPEGPLGHCTILPAGPILPLFFRDGRVLLLLLVLIAAVVGIIGVPSCTPTVPSDATTVPSDADAVTSDAATRPAFQMVTKITPTVSPGDGDSGPICPAVCSYSAHWILSDDRKNFIYQFKSNTYTI